MCVIEAELGVDFGEVAGDAVTSAVVGEFGGFDVGCGPRLYIIVRICATRIVALHVSARWEFMMVCISATVEEFWRR